ncbi:MAG: NAD(P)/FAD-dependent oxidoreductase [Marivibrio sp.]|uniref:NAD(P)/FAD-dependent oxidoreductase n=1 Tax=Marivibrio sp. TaxID=2039719 RepID=UPI0032EC390B
MDGARTDCVVIGAGVVGLAAARALALQGREVVVLEALGLIGSVTSSRNSEVIHAGIYYPTGGLKHRLCLEGKRALYAYCDAHGVPYRRCGKLIVATSADEEAALNAIAQKAETNGVEEMRRLSRAEAQAMEPDLVCTAALHSGSTGVVSSHDLMLAYQGDLEEAGGVIAFNAPVAGGEVLDDGRIRLEVGGDAPMRLEAELVVNAAGLSAQAVTAAVAGAPIDAAPPLHLAKGNYYALTGRAPFSRLIYPTPQPGGLGVHLTLDLAGQARFGPDVEWVEAIDYDVDPARAQSFYAAVRRYWPALPDGALVPAYAGIRPKVARPGGSGEDFVIQGPAEHGVRGWIGLYGIESPGLTASLALGDRVAAMA